MAIELIAKIKQKNNGTFPLMDASDVEWSEGESLVEHINSIDAASGGVGELNTTVSALQVKMTTAEQGIATNKSDIATINTKLAEKPEIDDTSASGTAVYSSTKVDSQIAAARQAVKDELLDGVGTEMDTLKEVAAAIKTNKDALAALQTVAGGHVKFDSAQVLTDPQKKQARDNIAAADTASVTALQNTVSGHTQNFTSINGKIQTMEGTITTQGSTLTELGERLTTAESAIDDHGTRLGEVETAAANAGAAASEAQNALDTFKASVGDTSTDFVAAFEAALA